MGILSGALTVRRFKVAGSVPDGWRETYRTKLDEFAFRDRPIEQMKEELEGWVQIHNLLDTSFQDHNRWLYNQYAIFALRVDKKSLPAKLLKATLEKRCEAWAAEKGAERCPPSVKKQLREELEHEWLKRTLPRVAVTEACWNVSEGWLLLHSLSESSADRFRKRFLRTFGLKLVPHSPLDWLPGSADALLNATPAILHQRGEA